MVLNYNNIILLSKLNVYPKFQRIHAFNREFIRKLHEKFYEKFAGHFHVTFYKFHSVKFFSEYLTHILILINEQNRSNRCVIRLLTNKV